MGSKYLALARDGIPRSWLRSLASVGDRSAAAGARSAVWMERQQQLAHGGRLRELNHLLQHTLRSLCIDSQWVYAVFWRILPRNYPPPQYVHSVTRHWSSSHVQSPLLVLQPACCNVESLARNSLLGSQPIRLGPPSPAHDAHRILLQLQNFSFLGQFQICFVSSRN